MNARELIEQLEATDTEPEQILVQVLDEGFEYHHIVGVEHLKFVDSDSTIYVAAIKVRPIRR